MNIWEQKLDLLGPIEQATRCLEIWLESEKRYLTEKQKQRTAALMARYFHHEDEVTDQLMLSFLRHYSGEHDVDMEDPTSVRMEIKAVLDKSQPYDPSAYGKRRLLTAFIVGVIIMAVTFSAWNISHKKITKEQQAELKSLVHQIVLHDPKATHAGVWADLKEPLQVKSYQDIIWWNYNKSRDILEKRLKSIPRPGM